jgi:hypothetical protein
MLDIGREVVRTPANEEAMLAEAEALVAEATAGVPDALPVPPVHRANVARQRRASPARFPA